MTTLQNIKKAKQLLQTTKYTSISKLCKDSGVSTYFAVALVKKGKITKTNGVYHWVGGVPNSVTYEYLRAEASDIIKKYANKPETVNRSESIVSPNRLSAGNGITVTFNNGKAVVSRNGRSIECDDLESVESLIKFIS